MKIEQKITGKTAILTLQGKLDGFQAETLENRVSELLDDGQYHFVFEMTGIDYLSSAGIRVLLKLLKKSTKLGGSIKLASLQPYPQKVLKIAGFLNMLDTFPTLQEALASIQDKTTGNLLNSEKITTPIGDLIFKKLSDKLSELKITGSNERYLKSGCRLEDISSEPLANFKYALGIGSLGEKAADNFSQMGELMIVNGSVVWLPTDGHNRPDFLIAAGQNPQINVHTAFNLVLPHEFEAVLVYHSNTAEGQKLNLLYEQLFKLAPQKFPAYKGMIGAVIRADLSALFGAGIKRSPIIDNKPENDQLITHEKNIKEWLDFQMDFRSETTSALIVGIGLDLTAEKVIANYDLAFHLPDTSLKKQFLHNHAALFEFIPERSNAAIDLNSEIDSILQEADFLSMQHLLDKTRVKKAVIGLFCIDRIIAAEENK